MKGLGHGAKDLTHARRLGARDPQTLSHLQCVQTGQLAGGDNRAENPAGAGDVPAFIVVVGVHRHSNTTTSLHAQHRGGQHIFAAGFELLAQGQCGGKGWR